MSAMLTRPNGTLASTEVSATEPPDEGVAVTPGRPDRKRTRRVVGIDIARALALIGMFTQHIFIQGPDGSTSTGWVAWSVRESAGRAAVLFFLLSGVSLAMIHRNGSFTAAPAVLRRRGFLLLAGGILLTLSIWPASILQHYGVAFLLAPWLLRLRWRGLTAVTAAGLVAGPIALLWLPRLGDDVLGSWDGVTGGWIIGQAWDLLVGGNYPMLIWIGFFTLGMTIGRTRLDTRRVAAAIAVGGIAATLGVGATAKHVAEHPDLGHGSTDAVAAGEYADVGGSEPGSVASDVGDDATAASPTDIDQLSDAELGAKIRAEKATWGVGDIFGDDEEGDGTTFDDPPIDWRSLSDTTGHSGKMGWTLQTSGIAAAVLGLALLIPRRLQSLLRPLAILGSMSLTAYLVHIALVNDAWDAHVGTAGWSVIEQEWVFAGLVAAMILTCLVFQRWLGTGPFEKMLKHFTLRDGDRPADADRRTPR